MAAHFWGDEIRKTMRYQLGETLGATAQHLLLMTATPHNGKEEDFQLFCSLLDSDQFAGRFRDGVHVADVSSLMRRVVKERLRTFEGRPLFPERRSNTVQYPLSSEEMSLYSQVTAYVQDQMNAADQLREGGDGRRGNTVGFALTILQRRLASSPAAIFQSLRRRRQRLEQRVMEERQAARAARLGLTRRQERLSSLLQADLADAGGIPDRREYGRADGGAKEGSAGREHGRSGSPRRAACCTQNGPPPSRAGASTGQSPIGRPRESSRSLTTSCGAAPVSRSRARSGMPSRPFWPKP